MSQFEDTAAEVGRIVTAKNKVYGNSFEKTQAFLSIIYPEGIRADQYGDILVLGRIFDKMMRIATGAKDEENPYLDIAGYAILALNSQNRIEKITQDLGSLTVPDEPKVEEPVTRKNVKKAVAAADEFEDL